MQTLTAIMSLVVALAALASVSVAVATWSDSSAERDELGAITLAAVVLVLAAVALFGAVEARELLARPSRCVLEQVSE